MSLFSAGYRILREEGPVALARRGAAYTGSRLYWSLKDDYDLSVDDVTVTFSAPNRTLVRRNRSRFSSEYDTLTELLDELGGGDVFFDVGANTGLYTLFGARRCSKVVAFEPYPPNVSVLERDVSRNDLSNVEIREIALSDSNGRVSFDQPDEVDVGYGSSSIARDDPDDTIVVPARTGDDLISAGEVPVPDVVKIDVEGSEPLVIDGLERTLSTPSCRLVYCEVHLADADHGPSIYEFDADLEDVKSRLRDCGFAVEESETREWEVFLKGYK